MDLATLAEALEFAKPLMKDTFNEDGGLMTNSGNILRFIAVRSTGELVAQSFATFCGIVTGKMDYSNSAGGTAHAISVVGMFDLPENRRRLASAK